MIITDRFIMLNFPKTGSSFARAVLKKVHRYDSLSNRIRRGMKMTTRPPLVELLLPVITRQSRPGERGQHGCYRQIPREHRDKPIVSIVRNPFERYVSAHLFGWWKTNPPADPDTIKELYPRFPDLSFQEHYEMNQRFGQEYNLQGIKPRIDLGMYTIQFINFFFPEPNEIFQAIDHEYILQKRAREHLPEISFLHQESLGQELYQYLLSLRYPENDISFILGTEKVNVTPRTLDQSNLANFYTPELVQDILEKDSLLFELFPEYRHSPIQA